MTGAALDQCLLVAIHRVEGPDPLTRSAGLYLDEDQQLVLAGNDVDLAPLGPAVIAREDGVASTAQPADGDPLTMASDPLWAAWRSIPLSQAAA